MADTPEWPERLTLRDTKVHADEGQRIYTTATGHGYERREYVRADVADQQLTRALHDAQYMLTAYRELLGPKAREVAELWDKQNVKRVHFDWGEAGQKLAGEDRAGLILSLANALRTEVTNVD